LVAPFFKKTNQKNWLQRCFLKQIYNEPHYIS
jgi:hypothetical protein